jgi:REP element-mobilizing transposase RayT
MYHIVCPSKYRKVVFSDKVDEVLKNVCLEISNRYEIDFLEIGVDNDHVHFLVQSVPMYSPTKIVRTIKSITAREIFSRVPEVKKQLWGGEFWSKAYYVSTVGKHGDEKKIANYVKNQGTGKNYKVLHQQASRMGQMDLFD